LLPTNTATVFYRSHIGLNEIPIAVPCM